MPGIYSEEQLQTIQEILLRANPNCTPPLSEIQEAATWFESSRPFDGCREAEIEGPVLRRAKKVFDRFAKDIAQFTEDDRVVFGGVLDIEAIVVCSKSWAMAIDSVVEYPSVKPAKGRPEANYSLRVFIARLAEICEWADIPKSCWHSDEEGAYRGAFFELVLACLAPFDHDYSRKHNHIALGQFIKDSLKKLETEPIVWEEVRRSSEAIQSIPHMRTFTSEG